MAKGYCSSSRLAKAYFHPCFQLISLKATNLKNEINSKVWTHSLLGVHIYIFLGRRNEEERERENIFADTKARVWRATHFRLQKDGDHLITCPEKATHYSWPALKPLRQLHYLGFTAVVKGKTVFIFIAAPVGKV
jgi:hypothetical protein